MHTESISWEDAVAAAKELDVEPCALWAVCQVESLGSGFVSSGRPKILFEGHIFWKELKRAGVQPEDYAGEHGNILYAKWTREHYKGGEAEYARLDAACCIHREAALKSASWGAFQIMGLNHQACGYSSVEDFVESHKACAANHLKAFCTFIRSSGCLPSLQNRDWAGFARRYNGPAYAQNRYDEKMRAAYEKCKATMQQCNGTTTEPEPAPLAAGIAPEPVAAVLGSVPADVASPQAPQDNTKGEAKDDAPETNFFQSLLASICRLLRGGQTNADKPGEKE
jgi:Protein of unknown function (DUF3380).